MSEAINTESLEKDLSRIEGKILRRSEEIKGMTGMSVYMHEKRQRMKDEIKELNIEKREIIRKIENGRESNSNF
jgi:predicted nuclease with TOPRIM domain